MSVLWTYAQNVMYNRTVNIELIKGGQIWEKLMKT